MVFDRFMISEIDRLSETTRLRTRMVVIVCYVVVVLAAIFGPAVWLALDSM